MDQTSTNSQRKLIGLPFDLLPLPNLIDIQTSSYDWFLKEGIKEVLEEVSPVDDYTGNILSLSFKDFQFGEHSADPEECQNKGLTHSAPLKVIAELTYLESGQKKSQEVFLGDIPLMTVRGTFIINGNERVVVNQLSRSPGVFYSTVTDPATGRNLTLAEVRPLRGAWLEFETAKNDILTVKIDRRRKIAATTLLRAFGFSTNEEIQALFNQVDTDSNHQYLESTLAKDPARDYESALLEIYRKMRPGEPAILENAKLFFENLLKNPRRYTLSKVGRYKINKCLSLSFPNEPQYWLLTPQDIVGIVKKMIELQNGLGKFDDIDHLANRRVRTVGELIQGSFRIGVLRLERIIRERMSIAGEIESLNPINLINARPVVASLNEFFGSSQLSQFMDQINPLHQLEHLRRLSVYGPGGLTRERAGFSVRDVHPSYYSRICPVKAPEGPSVGLLSSLAIFARINDYGFIEAPYRRVGHRDGKSYVTDEIDYLMADEEENFYIAEATIKIGDGGEILEERVAVRHQADFTSVTPEKLDYIDVTPPQMVGLSASLIPFIDSDAGRFPLMGSNMEAQAVPLVNPKSPLVGTGMEGLVLKDTGQLIRAEENGKVKHVDSTKIEIQPDKGKTKTYHLEKFKRTNQDTCYNQKPVVETGQQVKKGDLLADGACTHEGELALGRDLLVAFMPWEGFNYDDSVIISERLVKEDILTSIHVDEYEVSAMDTKLGSEEITRDIPNVSDEALRNLAEDGIVYIGAKVGPGDILVGKIAPKGETELSAEERLLRAIFGEKAREVRDTSLTMPYGKRGTVIGVTILTREEQNELPPGVLKLIKIRVAQKRKIAVGDKISGRHGSKGIIAKILPEIDMPYVENKNPVDIILNPLSILARMNVGQIIETHLGWAASKLNQKYAIPVYGQYKTDFVQGELAKADLPQDGKISLFDGRNGEEFSRKVTVGYAYIMKLVHLVEDKIHARSTGPYSLITQQPLGGKAQMGGQRLGEMEVWALEGYGAAHTLQEMLTIKSDDITGRAKAFEAIVKGIEIPKPKIPESFKVLIKELNGLGLNIEMLGTEEGEPHPEVAATEVNQNPELAEKKQKSSEVPVEKISQNTVENAIENPTPADQTQQISEGE